MRVLKIPSLNNRLRFSTHRPRPHLDNPSALLPTPWSLLALRSSFRARSVITPSTLTVLRRFVGERVGARGRGLRLRGLCRSRRTARCCEDVRHCTFVRGNGLGAVAINRARCSALSARRRGVSTSLARDVAYTQNNPLVTFHTSLTIVFPSPPPLTGASLSPSPRRSSLRKLVRNSSPAARPRAASVSRPSDPRTVLWNCKRSNRYFVSTFCFYTLP